MVNRCGIKNINDVMVENAEDVLGETKPNFVEFSGDVKPPKVEAKPNINGASIYVDSGVLPLQAHEFDTARFFFQTTLSRKIENNCLSGHVVKQIRRNLQLLHKVQA
ncbi:hypothetical protein MTR_1g024995 [Medicago truncatula]|uniref:Uncharacterized protein n=1 Tax=Medicago truncatula TaxID=3880 RepID=A0A072VQ16_MEDTR|nr:hypothetical protein MTR_1g024995 [Medicago truncatula]